MTTEQQCHQMISYDMNDYFLWPTCHWFIHSSCLGMNTQDLNVEVSWCPGTSWRLSVYIFFCFLNVSAHLYGSSFSPLVLFPCVPRKKENNAKRDNPSVILFLLCAEIFPTWLLSPKKIDFDLILVCIHWICCSVTLRCF